MKSNKAYALYMNTMSVIFLLLMVVTIPAFAVINSPGNLFIDEALDLKYIASDQPQVIRSRLVSIDFSRLCELESIVQKNKGFDDPGSILYLNLFEDVYFKAHISRVENAYPNGFSYIGEIENIPDSNVIMVVSGEILSANITMPGHFYQVRYIAEGMHKIQEIDNSRFPSDLPPVQVVVNENPELRQVEADSGAYIDVLVVYTATARSAAGGTSAINTLINLAISESNTGYSHSSVTQRLRLAHSAEVTYSESGFDWSETLDRLQGASDGYMDEVHTLRNTYKADEVVLLVSASDSCGIGYLMQTLSSSFASYAFCVVSTDCATGYYSFAHEMGHNMGCAHDRANASSDGVYNYSYGYQAPDEAFRTIMAYDCPGTCPRVNYWSNPNKTYGGQAMGVVDSDPNAADNHKSLNNTAYTVANFRQSSSVTPAKITLDRTALYFTATTSGKVTGQQSILIRNSGGTTLNWTASESTSWLSISPTSGTNSGILSVSVSHSGLLVGTYTGTISISDSSASNSPQTISVTFKIIPTGSAKVPFGEFSTPTAGSTVRSSIPVTGWVLDDIDVTKVEIFNGSSYVGDAVFVKNARPDVETAYPGYPKNYQAGWGYMLLSYFLPNQGNGSYTLYAKATDAEGNQVTLGSKTITIDNAHAVKPFGAIDTPTQGGTSSGKNYLNWGWVLTPTPNSISTNGSTINVYVDGVSIGHPTYNNYRADIASLFPGYANSNGAVGYKYIDTTKYTSGVHTIQWTASDSGGNSDGIGSRYFSIINTGSSDNAEILSDISWAPDEMKTELLTNDRPIHVRKGYNDKINSNEIYPDNRGVVCIEIKELERVEMNILGQENVVSPNRFSGYMVVGKERRSLPIGSTLDKGKGVFYWSPGPGFIGRYELVFIDKENNTQRRVIVKILPK